MDGEVIATGSNVNANQLDAKLMGVDALTPSTAWEDFTEAVPRSDHADDVDAFTALGRCERGCIIIEYDEGLNQLHTTLIERKWLWKGRSCADSLITGGGWKAEMNIQIDLRSERQI